MESIIIKVPKKSDAKMLIEITERMGFVAEILEHKLDRIIRTAPRNVPISDEQIMEEVYASRSK